MSKGNKNNNKNKSKQLKYIRSFGDEGGKNTSLISKVQSYFILYQWNLKENGFMFSEKGKSNEYSII